MRDSFSEDVDSNYDAGYCRRINNSEVMLRQRPEVLEHSDESSPTIGRAQYMPRRLCCQCIRDNINVGMDTPNRRQVEEEDKDSIITSGCSLIRSGPHTLGWMSPIISHNVEFSRRFGTVRVGS
jgi:hypothetical protein